MLKIRKLQKKDIKSIVGMMFEFPLAYPSNYINSKKRGSIRWFLAYALRSKDKFDIGSFVLEMDHKVIGHIAYFKDDRVFSGGVYEMRALIVDKKYQGKGYGKKLIEYLEEELKKIKARIIWLQTEKEEADYYKKLGYKLIAVYKNYWGIGKDRFVLGRNLIRDF